VAWTIWRQYTTFVELWYDARRTFEQTGGREPLPHANAAQATPAASAWPPFAKLAAAAQAAYVLEALRR